MNKRSNIISALLIIFLMILTMGCAAETYSTAQINPVDQAKIHAVRINMKPFYQVEFTDAGLIGEMIDNLGRIDEIGGLTK